MSTPPVIYPVGLDDLMLFADAGCELDSYKDTLADNPAEQARIVAMVERIHDTVERVAGVAGGMIYQDEAAPLLDYDAVKKYYFSKGAGDCAGRGRFESAFFHTIRMVFEQGLNAGAKSAEQRSSGDATATAKTETA